MWHKKFNFFVLFVITVTVLIHLKFWLIPAQALQREDIYYIWLEGKRIISGENPYARILAGDMRVNDKYATYFPLTYLFSALSQKLGFPEFQDWLFLWRPLSLAFNLGIVLLILKEFQKRGLWILGFTISLIVVLGRWSIFVVRVHHIEFAAIFCLILSLILLETKTRLALLMFSVSLAIKQIGIFLLPLYLIYLWRNSCKNNPIQAIFWGSLIILSVPLATSLPFIIWNAEGFFKSILFSATRLEESHIRIAASIDVMISHKLPWFVGIKAKVFMLALMGMVYLSFLIQEIKRFTAASIIFVVFVYFNSVLFIQYFAWVICLLPFALLELIETPLKYTRNTVIQQKEVVSLSSD